MANKENLISLADRTTEEKREIAIKGGRASGKVRKEKASFKKAIKWLLEESDIRITKGPIYEKYKEQGIDISKLTPEQLATIGQWTGAVIGKYENYKVLMEGNDELKSIGTTETPDVEFKEIDNSHLEKTLYEHKDD